MPDTQKRKHLTREEVKRLLLAARQGPNPERDCCLIWMCFIHGCRVSEIITWRMSDIDIKGKSIYIKRLKNGFSTTHPIYQSEIDMLDSWLKVRAHYDNADSEWLFLSRKGQRISRQRIYQFMRQYGNQAGLMIKPHPHMLRHACGYALAEKGVDTRLIQDYLGHRNIQHTVLYTASNEQRFKEVWSN
ncbi:tyrosine-type DNA invertase [Klebsiella oxytoca]|uniref:Tyrosine-type recombinase/integrase n=1 Tax=Klebsiella oxytoca TaxID=571 RepID=A0AAP2FPK1_KLEOX|nr:tyrosine-type DNA invertase [Klebsiella oxytoca]EJB5616472.1 tyrosine-type recombinase/integrase [Klebsiella oxytoca]EJZ8385746.1 tyrosine-type recombinase/integrase [Klebsiella oxytoca]EKW7111064.1 tyrosine-type recombinase/integrase [Klebsiella oxytoca]EKX1747304.1 tyrosine-type recombinase/integrase [Klebsiella oxytoca]ELN5375316.1 tyrosine-type recombinase/integrase [Klebsiella oxytoca]